MGTITKWKVVLVLVASLALTVSLGGIGPSPALAWEDWRMTGGGSIFNRPDIDYGGTVKTSDGGRVTHGFELHCMQPAKDNLEIVDHETKLNFHLEDLTYTECTDDPTINPVPPPAPFDTFYGEGIGRCNIPGGGRFPCDIVFTFTDGGERGGCVRDTAEILITDRIGVVLLYIPYSEVDCGNHQAHGVAPY